MSSNKSTALVKAKPVSYTHLDVYKRQPYYDPAAKLVARVLRLKHNVAYLQRQRGEVETERRISTSQTLYEQTHRVATLTRAISLQRRQGLAQPPKLDWSARLDDSSERCV